MYKVKLISRFTALNRRSFCKTKWFSYDKYCQYCKGKKISTCLDCKGYGKIYRGGRKECLCNNCFGSGYVMCDICGGSGSNMLY